MNNIRITSLLIVIIAGLIALSSCTPKNIEPDFSVSDFYVQQSENEVRQFRNDSGHTVLSIKPKVESKEDMETYREQKMTETKYILSITGEESEKVPHFPTTVTFSEPISLDELRSIIAQYEIPHVDIVRYNSSTGGGQMPYEMIEKNELSSLERKIALGLPDGDNFSLIKTISAMKCAIHKDKIIQFQNDPRIYLADIGPAELYEEGGVDKAAWDDLAYPLQKIRGGQ